MKSTKRERERERESKLEGGELDLREFKNLDEVDVGQWLNTPLTKLDVSGLVKLEVLVCCDNNLTSVDFLTQLPNLEKLRRLDIWNNNIQPTDISIFSKFVNLKSLSIGTMKGSLQEGKHNKFYGSLESWKDLTKLESICIEATDVDTGLEYLPFSLAEATRWGNYSNIECSPHSSDAKCSQIQDQLRPFNYDLEAWQLTHPEKMLIARPELFTNPSSKDKWLTSLNNKILQVREEIITTKQNETDKTKKISRLESKLQLLKDTKTKLEKELEKEQQQHNQTKTNFQSQLRDLATILFPSNHNLDYLNFADLKDQVQKTLQIQTQNEQKITNLQTQLANTQKANHESAKQKDQTIKEIIEELKQANQKITQLEQIKLELEQAAQEKWISDKTYLTKIDELEKENKALAEQKKSLQYQLGQSSQLFLSAEKSLSLQIESYQSSKNILKLDLKESKTTITQLETKLKQQSQLTETKLKAINASLDPKSNPDAPIDFDSLKEKIFNTLANHQQVFQSYQEELETKDQKIEELEQLIKTIKTKPTVKDSATQTDQLQGTKDAGTQTDTFVETKKEEVAEEDCIKFLKALEQRCSEWYPILLANINAEGEHAKELERVYNRDLYLLLVSLEHLAIPKVIRQR